jgi:hypothetical protein
MVTPEGSDRKGRPTGDPTVRDLPGKPEQIELQFCI